MFKDFSFSSYLFLIFPYLYIFLIFPYFPSFLLFLIFPYFPYFSYFYLLFLYDSYFFSSIKESLTILAKIDFRNYPIIDDGVNLYAKKLKPIVSVYDKMANCFEINDLTETMTLILNSIVENITKQIGNTKIENDNQLKQ